MNFYAYTTAFTEIAVEPDGFEKTIEIAKDVRSNEGKVYFVGNGGSAAIASHMAVDWLNKAKFAAMAFNDLAALTCLANDYGYEHVFAKQMKSCCFMDLLVAISSSGESESILNAVDVAIHARTPVVTLSGFDMDNTLRQRGDINFYVPSHDYGVVETVHLGILHTLLEALC